MALRVPERWARAFEGIYQEAPRWYLSDGGADTFRQAAFHHSLVPPARSYGGDSVE